jgi:hypothetical protein
MLEILNTLFYVLGAAAIIALPFMLVNQFKYLKVRAANRSRFVPLPAKFPVKSVLFFVGPIILAIAISEIMTSYCRAEVLNFLRDLSGDYKIYVNSQPAHEPQRIVGALKEVAPQLGHHSHPTKMIRVEIQSDKGSVTLELGRDSGYAQEYWVFYPKYGVTSNNEIGRVTTPIFDEQ